MAGETILIVDDEHSIADLLKLHLEEERYKTLSALSVNMALKIIEKDRPDLILLDIRMPGKDGFDLLKSICTKHGTPKIPVLAMTGRNELQSVLEKMAVDGFLAKPFEMADVLQKIHWILSQKRKVVYLADSEGSVQAQAIASELRDERFNVFFIKEMEDIKRYTEKQSPDYVIMEYMQHSTSGEILISELKKFFMEKGLENVPIVVYTYSGMNFNEKSLKAGASVYVGKPQDSSALITIIRKLEMKSGH